ncbi:hypothetical protein JW796_01550 [Candidatus Dojkabacteria bacterium]|nr:hypothetical protein [Candidatus Dojkabacteria bacterium]
MEKMSINQAKKHFLTKSESNTSLRPFGQIRGFVIGYTLREYAIKNYAIMVEIIIFML